MECRGYWRAPADSPITQGYHYNHNCETYMLVGDAIARGMLELIGAGNPGPYAIWSGGAVFTDDDNGDGVDNGLAWILGAAGPDASALNRLPAASVPAGFLQLDFTRQNPRGPARLYLEYGTDLTGWTRLEIPAGTGMIGGDIEVTVTGGTPDTIRIKIPQTHAGGGRLFGRLSAKEN
jgi:hypothetical protein